MALCRSRLDCGASCSLTLHRPRLCVMRQGLSFMSFRAPVPLAHTHGNHSSKSLTRLHTDRSANLQTVSGSAAPGISTEVPAWGKDFDIGTFATANPASISDASPPDTSWIRPVWDALKPASAAAICVVARAVGGKGVLLALSFAGQYYMMAVWLAGLHVALCTAKSGAFAAAAIPGALYICCALFSLTTVNSPMVTIDVSYPYLQGRLAVPAAAWGFAKSNTHLIKLLDGLLAWGPRVLLLLALATWMKGVCPTFAATYSSACDAFKTCAKLPQLFALMSPGPAATDNDSGAKHAWQALVLLFLGVAAAILNRGVGAKGVCLAAMTLLEFGKPVWVWVGLCVALATWQKQHWNNKCGSAAAAAVICSMYVLTMQLVTSAAYWKECFWREIRISNSVFQGVVRVVESSAEVLSRETTRGGIEFVGLLLTWGSRLLLLCSLAMFFRAVLPPDTMEKAIKATQNRFSFLRPAVFQSKVTKAPVSSAQAALNHTKAAATKPSEADTSPVSSAAEAPADTAKTAASAAAAAEAGGVAAVTVSPNTVEPDVLMGSALPDSLSIHMKAVNDFLAHEDNLHLEATEEHNGNAAAGEDELAMTARAEEAKRDLRPAFVSAPTTTPELVEQLAEALKQLEISEGRAEKAETALGRLQRQAEEAERQVRQAEGRAETAQTALKELQHQQEEAARIRSETPLLEVRPKSAGVVVPEQATWPPVMQGWGESRTESESRAKVVELEGDLNLALTRAYVAELALKDHQQQAEEEERKEKQVSEHRLGAAKQAGLEARGRAEQAEAALAEVEQALKLQLEEANQKLKVSKGRAVAVQTALVELQAQAQEVEGLLTSRAQEARTALKEAQGRAEQAEAALQNLKHEVQAAEEARAAAGQAGTASSQGAAGDGDKRHLEQMTLLLRQLLKGRTGAGKQAQAASVWSTPASSETTCATQSTSQQQASFESGIAVEEPAEQKQTSPEQGDGAHSHDHLHSNIVQVVVDPRLFK